jgi:hypothetical protein
MPEVIGPLAARVSLTHVVVRISHAYKGKAVAVATFKSILEIILVK